MTIYLTNDNQTWFIIIHGPAHALSLYIICFKVTPKIIVTPYARAHIIWRSQMGKFKTILDKSNLDFLLRWNLKNYTHWDHLLYKASQKRAKCIYHTQSNEKQKKNENKIWHKWQITAKCTNVMKSHTHTLIEWIFFSLACALWSVLQRSAPSSVRVASIK